MLANPVKIKYGKIFNQYIIDLSSNNLLLTKEVLASFLNNFNNDVVKKELVPSSGKGKDKDKEKDKDKDKAKKKREKEREREKKKKKKKKKD